MAAAFAFADAHDDVIELVTSMANALTEVIVDGNGVERGRGNVSGFMAVFSKDMPDYDTLKNNVTGLLNEGEVSSSIRTVTEDGDDEARSIDLDWVLEVRSLEQDGPIIQRREVIHCELRKGEANKKKQHWKIVAIKPIDFFSPAKLAQ